MHADQQKPLSKSEFDSVKAALGSVIKGEPLPSFRDAKSMDLVRSCGRIAETNATELLASLGAFALARLVEHQERSFAAEVELAALFPNLRQ
jgi:hypothetical protein